VVVRSWLITAGFFYLYVLSAVFMRFPQLFGKLPRCEFAIQFPLATIRL
jgi:hypothetical protein